MKNIHYFILLIIIAIAVIVSIFSFTEVDTGISTMIENYKIGDKAEDFKLKNVDDKMVSMADFKKAKGFIIIFTCNSCPYSVANEDRIIALDKKYKKKGYPVIAINPNNPALSPEDSFEMMKERSKQKGFTFPYLFDEDQEVFPLYGATRTPHVFVLKKNKLDYIVNYIGAIDDSSRSAETVKTKYVENAIDALIDGKPVEVTHTKAIGCSIKK